MTKGYLLDTNLLIALLWPAHSQHAAAVAWFKTHRALGWATCPMTEAGFVRIISNPAFSRDFVTPVQALGVLRQNTDSKDHQFWIQDICLPEALKVFKDRLLGHQQVADACLLSLAIRRRAKLATFDAGVASLLDSAASRSSCLEVLNASIP